MSPEPRRTVMLVAWAPSAARRPSKKTIRSTGRSGESAISTTSEGEVRKARAWMVWGATGTQTMPVKEGVTMGPPAESA